MQHLSLAAMPVSRAPHWDPKLDKMTETMDYVCGLVNYDLIVCLFFAKNPSVS